MGKFQVISHPLIQHKLSILRREDTSTKDFRELVNEIAMLMGYEVSRDLPLEEVEIQTPITKTVQNNFLVRNWRLFHSSCGYWYGRWFP